MEYLTALHQPPSRERDEKITRIKALFPTTQSGATHANANGVTLPSRQMPLVSYGWITPLCTKRRTHIVLLFFHTYADKKPASSLPFKKEENEKKGRFGGLIRVAERLVYEHRHDQDAEMDDPYKHHLEGFENRC